MRLRQRLWQRAAGRLAPLIGDDCRVGANAALAPGALLLPASVAGRGRVLDQDMLASDPR